MDYRGLNQTILKLMTPTATYMINVNVSTILGWSGKVYLLKICHCVLDQDQVCCAKKLADTESRLFC